MRNNNILRIYYIQQQQLPIPAVVLRITSYTRIVVVLVRILPPYTKQSTAVLLDFVFFITFICIISRNKFGLVYASIRTLYKDYILRSVPNGGWNDMVDISYLLYDIFFIS